MSSCGAVRAGRRGGGGGTPVAASGRTGSEGLWKKRGGRATTAGQAALGIAVSGKTEFGSLDPVSSMWELRKLGIAGWGPARRRMRPTERLASSLRRRSPP